MKRICILTVILLIISMAFAQESPVIDVASTRILTPPPDATHTEELPVADHLQRVAIVFEFPDNFFEPSTVILDAQMMIKIEPTERSEESFPIFCIPLIEPATSLSAFTEITEDLLRYSEVWFYDPESGELFFEMSHMLREARNGNVRFYGIALVPGDGAPTFSIAEGDDAISLECGYGIGKRDVR